MEIEVWQFVNSGIFLFCAGIVYKNYKDSKERAKEEEEHRKEMFDNLFEENRKLAEKIEDISSKYSEIVKEIKDLKNCVSHLSAGGLTILRDRILQSCRQFIERGSITLIAKDNIKDMYSFYHDVLHGNGIVQEYYEMMLKLPVEDTPVVGSFKVGEVNEIKIK